MKAGCIDNPFSFKVLDIPQPRLSPDDILVKVKSCGVCGTDIHIYEGEAGMAKYPVIPGHEFSGIVAEVGREASQYISVGDRVVIDPNVTCGHCFYCRSGRRHFCDRWSPIGVIRNGAFAEYVAAPSTQAYRIPETLSFEEAVFTEPLSCCIHGWKRINPKPGFSTVIIGGGPIGLLHLQIAKRLGSTLVIVSEPINIKRQLAERLGADVVVNPTKEDLLNVVKSETDGQGADVVVEAVGDAKLVEEAFNVAGFGAKILVFGVASEKEIARVSPYQVYRKELTILGSFINPYTMDEALRLLASHTIEVKPLITHKISLKEAEKALKREFRDSVKILIAF